MTVENGHGLFCVVFAVSGLVPLSTMFSRICDLIIIISFAFAFSFCDKIMIMINCDNLRYVVCVVRKYREYLFTMLLWLMYGLR